MGSSFAALVTRRVALVLVSITEDPCNTTGAPHRRPESSAELLREHLWMEEEEVIVIRD